MSSNGSAGRIVLVVGGVRSGKSRYAQQLATSGKRVAFIATAEARDEDMAQRIARHKEERPAAWTTIEEPLAIAEALRKCGNQFDTIVIDCLTVWASNLLANEGEAADRIQSRASQFVQVLRQAPARVILVSNEVGSGIIPNSEMGRTYRDVLGGINQRVAAAADEVVLLVAGCPLVIKPAAEVAV